jgi:hypothetical protein
MIDEGIAYATELVYMFWIIISLALCSGMFVENPVTERMLRI